MQYSLLVLRLSLTPHQELHHPNTTEVSFLMAMKLVTCGGAPPKTPMADALLQQF